MYCFELLLRIVQFCMQVIMRFLGALPSQPLVDAGCGMVYGGSANERCGEGDEAKEDGREHRVFAQEAPQGVLVDVGPELDLKAAQNSPSEVGDDGPIPALRSGGDIAAGSGAPAGGLPPGPLTLAVPSAAPGGLGVSGSGGDGPSVLVAIVAGGPLGLGLARGGVLHDRAARLTGLAGGPGCLPG